MKYALVLALCLFVSPTFAQWDRPLDRGGRVAPYYADIAVARGQHRISGDCVSACSAWLGYRGTCIEPSARVYFHAVERNHPLGAEVNPWTLVDPAGTDRMMAHYPPKVRAIVASWMQSPELSETHSLSGRDLTGLGVPACDR